METFGIENITKVLKWGAELSNVITDAILDDGKIDFGEGIKIGLKAVGIPVKSFKGCIDEFKDLTSEERQQIIDSFVEDFDISDEEAEKMVEQAMEFVLTLVQRILSRAEEREIEV